MNLFREWTDLVEEEKNAFLHKLGPLAYLVGVWEGSGFTVISRPSPQSNQIFQFLANKTLETLWLTPLILSVKNRGEAPQPDIKLNGLLYKQGIVDAENITNILHFEAGQWLLIPATKNPDSKATVARQATILHGATFIATGDAPDLTRNPGKPNLDIADTTPIPLSGGPLDDQYLKPITKTNPPDGLPNGSIKDPNLVLAHQISTQSIVDHVKFSVSAKLDTSVKQADGSRDGAHDKSPGISNIPFLDHNAQVREFDATFYIEHVDTSSGNSFMQLQYTQRAILRFAGIDWPHLSVATLRRVLL
jgi:hypothetical protein